RWSCRMPPRLIGGHPHDAHEWTNRYLMAKLVAGRHRGSINIPSQPGLPLQHTQPFVNVVFPPSCSRPAPIAGPYVADPDLERVSRRGAPYGDRAAQAVSAVQLRVSRLELALGVG